MRIALASDHAGFRTKELIASHLRAAGHAVQDFGTHSTESVDYPLFIRPAAEAVADGRCERGIVLGGSGNGEAMAANRVTGVRCALCWSVESARLARAHNDANMISLGERLTSPELALAIVDTWLATPFEGGRHVRRLALLDHAAGAAPGPENAMSANPVPEGFHTVTPYLVVDKLDVLVDFAERGVGARVLHGTSGPDGRLAHVTFQVGDSRVMAGQARGESKPHPATLYLYVADADASYRRALEAGASSLVPPTDMPYGDRAGSVTDACGTMWWFATHKEDLSEAEIQRRCNAATGKA